MKTVFTMIVLFGTMALAQTATPALPPVVPSPGLLDLLLSHLGVISAALIAVLDLIFALRPSANSPDGLLHLVYLLLTTGKASKPVA